MAKSKSPKAKGKISLTRYFQKFSPGDYVAVTIEPSVKFGFPKKLQGRTGKIMAKRGFAYDIEINDLNMPKSYTIKPVHLKKIEIKQI